MYPYLHTGVGAGGDTVNADSFGGWYGRYLSADSRGLVRDHPWPYLGAASPGADVVSIMYWLSGLLALFLFGYLLYALLRAEQF
jgi:K+-transporting ATPase KdpF subunit